MELIKTRNEAMMRKSNKTTTNNTVIEGKKMKIKDYLDILRERAESKVRVKED